MMTDTVNVWAEVLDAKYISHRARHAHSTHGKPKRGFALPYHDADEEAEWRRGVVQTLGEVHAQAMDGGVEVEVRASEVSDLSFCVSDAGRDFHWRWDVVSVRMLAAGVLSKQLFMPLVTLAAVTSSLGQNADDVSEVTLRTVAERKASTAKVMPVHHLRGFFSRPAIQTTLSCIAQVDAAPSVSSYSTANRLTSTPSINMSDPPPESSPRITEPKSPLPTIWSGDVGNRPDSSSSGRKGKGRDDTEDESEEDGGGSVRKTYAEATPRRSGGGRTGIPTPARRDEFPRLINPDTTATEAESTRDMTRAPIDNSHSRTIDEDEDMDVQFGRSPKYPSPAPRLTSPKAGRPSPRDRDKPRPAPRVSNATTSDVFGATQTQTQASSDDSDREAELARRVRAAGTIGSTAVRAPAGGLGTRMVRKKF